MQNRMHVPKPGLSWQSAQETKRRHLCALVQYEILRAEQPSSTRAVQPSSTRGSVRHVELPQLRLLRTIALVFLLTVRAEVGNDVKDGRGDGHVSVRVFLVVSLKTGNAVQQEKRTVGT